LNDTSSTIAISKICIAADNECFELHIECAVISPHENNVDSETQLSTMCEDKGLKVQFRIASTFAEMLAHDFSIQNHIQPICTKMQVLTRWQFWQLLRRTGSF
jgi:hypothetical protein